MYIFNKNPTTKTNSNITLVDVHTQFSNSFINKHMLTGEITEKSVR